MSPLTQYAQPELSTITVEENSMNHQEVVIIRQLKNPYKTKDKQVRRLDTVIQV